MNTRRHLKIILMTLVPVILMAPLLGCGSESDETELPETQIATVQRGNLTIDITAAGNLALSHTEDLAVDIFYGQSGATGTKGTIGEVLVEEGDTVEEGQVLVTIDRDEWEDELSALEDLVTAKERALVDAQISLIQAEQSLKSAQDNLATKELAVLNAQISLDQAKRNLSTGITASDYDLIESEYNKAVTWYEYVQERMEEATDDMDRWLERLELAKEQLEAAEVEYNNILSGYGSEEVAIKKKQVEAAEMSLASAQEALNDVTEAIALAELQLTRKEGSVTDAQKALVDAQEDLAEAQSKSPEIKAPFAGFITSVNVEGGDEVLDGTVAVQLADPEKFEADILVSEMDILQVELDTEAWVEVDAMPGMSLPATVTHISPTATIQSGVVNYEVKVEVESMQAVAREPQAASQQAMPDIAAGEIPAPLQQAIDEGRLTREQVEEMIKQGPPPGMEPPPGFTPPEGFTPPGMEGGTGQTNPATSQAPMTVPEDFQLREGLTVTVSIIVDERTDVLLVPNAAIASEGGESYVQFVTETGETEQRAVQTGLTDYQFTEVTEGLSEGDNIIVPQGTATVTTTEEGPPRMGLFGPPRR